MLETQNYKKGQDFPIPAQGVGIVRTLFVKRLETVNEVLNDPQSKRVFSRADLEQLAFEQLMLTQMVVRMRGAAHA
ncbi:hypothetical protein [Massilia sp. GCM10023247]|uniref:hypothetical protein n=1 Tax=Massilia sp. GCM10023247 TaxID=3252643 RepID=UPI00360E9EFD